MKKMRDVDFLTRSESSAYCWALSLSMQAKIAASEEARSVET